MADDYTPDEEHMSVAWIEYDGAAEDINEAETEFDRFIAKVKRDAAREALDGLIEDAAIDVRLGAEGNDPQRVQDAEAVMDSTQLYRDTEYPEETP